MKGIALLLALAAAGCGTQMFSARTKGSFILADGTTATYESSKDQQGFNAEYDPATKKFTVHVDKANTSDTAVNAALQQTILMGKLIERLLPLLEKAAVVAAPAARGITTIRKNADGSTTIE